MRPTHSLTTFLKVACLPLLSIGIPFGALADEDPSKGMIRSLNIDNASIQNTYYLSGSVDNNTSAGHYLYLYGEGLFSLEKDWGLVIDLPEIIARQPLGQGPGALESIGANLRYVAYQFGTSDSDEAGLLSLQIGGDYAFPDSRFRFFSGSLTPELLAGYRFGKFFLQGNYGFNEMVDRPSRNNLFLNTGLGYTLNPEWFLQVESNSTLFLNDSSLGSDWTIVPQVAFQTGDWLFELGEEFNGSASGSTDFMVARAL